MGCGETLMKCILVIINLIFLVSHIIITFALLLQDHPMYTIELLLVVEIKVYDSPYSS